MGYGKSYRNDPHWITLKWAGNCTGCGTEMLKGSRAFYYPLSKSMFGEKCGCGKPQADRFAAETFDEMEGNNRCL